MKSVLMHKLLNLTTNKETTMNIDDLTLGQIKQLKGFFNETAATITSNINSALVGKKVIVRTFSAGVHYGEVQEKEGKEIILKNARRLWYWKTTNGGISLSEIAIGGVHKDSKICAAVNLQWLDAIEIIPCTAEAIKNIEASNEYKA